MIQFAEHHRRNHDAFEQLRQDLDPFDSDHIAEGAGIGDDDHSSGCGTVCYLRLHQIGVSPRLG